MIAGSELPLGVELRELQPHHDERGSFTELHRDEWEIANGFVQWNAVKSAAGVLRGVHLHRVHSDYLTVVAGRATIGLVDLRPKSESYRSAACVELSGENPRAIAIPVGVAHGFYFPEPSIHVYAVSDYWSMNDEFGCRWDDSDLAIPWMHEDAIISERDAQLPSLDELIGQISGWDDDF